MSPTREIAVVVSMPFDENTYILWRPGRSDALVVDPGLEPDRVLAFLAEKNLRPAALLGTHGHADHIGGLGELKAAFPDAPIVIGAGDAAMLSDATLNLSAPFGMPITAPPADRTVREGDRLSLAGFDLAVFEIPGHSPGHVVFVVEGDAPTWVLGGDVLFEGSIGRTDFPGGSFESLRDGIRRVLFALPDDAVVFPGHGSAIRVGDERRTNPFVGEEA